MLSNEWTETDKRQKERIKELEGALTELIEVLANCPGKFNYSAIIEDTARSLLKKTEGGT